MSNTTPFFKEFPDPIRFIPISVLTDFQADLSRILTLAGVSYLILNQGKDSMLLILKPEEIRALKSGKLEMVMKGNEFKVKMNNEQKSGSLTFYVEGGVIITIENDKIKVEAGEEKHELKGETNVGIINGFLLISVKASGYIVRMKS